ncbi:hypothetical protein [Mesorhizobium sp. Cs1299R1N3]|uniref:hypothetical protein n=1 Tax=Mesorhizobium sp. Cs1299R1N3 TaxID=3015173 RepID=UPI00301BE61C
MSKELWVDAGKILAGDPKAVVKCPDCGEATLDVHDSKVDATHFERHMRCPKCGAYNGLLKRIEGE